MRLREQSELGWLMLQLVGALALPHVTRDAQLRETGKERLHELFRARPRGTPGLDRVKALLEDGILTLPPAQRRYIEDQDSWPRAGTDRATGEAQPQTRSPGPALTLCPRCGAWCGGMSAGVCMDCDV